MWAPLHSLWRGAAPRKVSLNISLHWLIYIITQLTEPKLSCYTARPPAQHHSFFRNLFHLFICDMTQKHLHSIPRVRFNIFYYLTWDAMGRRAFEVTWKVCHMEQNSRKRATVVVASMFWVGFVSPRGAGFALLDLACPVVYRARWPKRKRATQFGYLLL